MAPSYRIDNLLKKFVITVSIKVQQTMVNSISCLLMENRRMA